MLSSKTFFSWLAPYSYRITLRSRSMYLLIPSIYVLLVIETNVFLFVPYNLVMLWIFFWVAASFPTLPENPSKSLTYVQHYKDTFMAILKHCVCIEMTQVTYEKNPAFLPRTSSYHPRFHFQVNSSAVKSFEDVKSFVLQLCAPDVIVTVSWPRHFLEFSPPHHYPSFLLMFRTVVKNLSKRLILSASISDRNR